MPIPNLDQTPAPPCPHRPVRLKVSDLLPAHLPLLAPQLLRYTVSIDCSIIAPSAREQPIDQYISGLTVSDDARLFPGYCKQNEE